MTDETAPMTGDAHEAVQLLLPWFASGRLDPEEAARVRSHLDACAICAREQAGMERIASVYDRDRLDTDHGWAALLPRLDSPPRSAVTLPFARRLRVVAAPLLLAAGLAIGVIAAPDRTVPGDSGSAPGAYRGLGSTSVPGNALLLLAPGASEADLHAALRASGARVVDGPTGAGAWVLSVPADRFEQRLAVLQSSRNVRLAHPLAGAAE